MGILWHLLVIAIEVQAPSAVRPSNENYMDSMVRTSAKEGFIPSGSAFDSAVSFSDLAIESATEWKSERSPVEIFDQIRDTRDIKVRSSFARRPSWMYPDDGCFARADYVRLSLKKNHAIETSKLFIFGNLEVDTENSPSGKVTWWYHVVPAFRKGAKLFVFDPAIDPTTPLLVQNWIVKMTQSLDADFKVSLCTGEAYSPYSECQTSTGSSSTMQDLLRYLRLEYDRALEMNRNPQEILKDLPPWRSAPEAEFLKALN